MKPDENPRAANTPFEERFAIRWSDLDANRHVRNTIYSELATQTRVQLLEANGYPASRFERDRFGPVMFREEIRYRRELHFGETAVVNVLFAGLSEDGSQWRARQEITREDGKPSAILTIDGAWIDIDRRKLIAPPTELLEIVRGLPRTADFELLRSVLRKGGTPGD